MNPIEPRYASSEVRQNRDRLVEAGFVYAGERSDGHFDFIHPTGQTFVLSGTPTRGQTPLVKDVCRKVAGIGQRGGFDRTAQRTRQARVRAQREAEIAKAAEARRAREADSTARAKAHARHRELAQMAHLMGMNVYSQSLI